jgi:Reverse transcriptase (RNA-dependent DNA polymerase)
MKKDATGLGDFEDSFSSVPHASGLRIMMALATQHNMFMDHVDISQAFCQGDLLPGDGHNGKVYISAPPGYPEDPDICYLLRKPLYGMPSAARAWHKTMSGFLASQGCSKVGYEESMWMAVSDGHKILIAAHIDDFIISCAHRPTLDKFKNALLARFDGTSEGAIRTYLGCEIERDMIAGTTVLSQKHYAEDVLRTFGFWDAHPLSTILAPHSRLSKEDCDPSPARDFHLRYRAIVGSLGYLVNMTRPDLAFAYSELSKYVQHPGLPHMQAAEHALRYLRGTFDKSLKFSRDTPLVDTVWGWVDSDWAGDTDTRRSHAAYILMLNGGPISWKSRRQDSVALSTSEAEYMAASEVGKEIQYLRALLHDVGFTQLSPTNVYEDNLACIAMSTNPVRRKSSRHIDMRVHYCRELYLTGVMKLIPLRTHLMVADALTKSLPGPALSKHRDVMMGHMPFFARLLHCGSQPFYSRFLHSA